MNVQSARQHEGPDAYTGARRTTLLRILRSHGVLTRSSLAELAGAEHWSVDFNVVLSRAVDSGQIRALTDELFEASGD